MLQRSPDATTLIYKVHDNAPTNEAPSEAPDILTEAQIGAIGEALFLERKLRREETAVIVSDLQKQIDTLRGQIESKNVVPMHGKTNAA